MQYKILLSSLILALCLATEVAAQDRGNGEAFRDPRPSSAEATPTATNNRGNNNNNNNKLALNPQAVQSGSDQDGTKASGSQAGQAASATDAANFINFCAGKTLTNGLQNKGGSCNGIPMGDIPSTERMVSTVITFPENGANIPAKQDFELQATSINMQFGAFTNAQATYYSAPQALNKEGDIIGHLHFSVQKMSNANVKTPLDPKTFAFFKGVNDAGNGRGSLKAAVAGGLDAGTYRVCTMTSAANHQPVLMPVAQRGPQDDCVRFTVGGNGAGNAGNGNNNAGNNNNNNNRGNDNNNNNAGNNSGNNNNAGNNAGNNNNNNNNNNNRGNNNNNGGAAASSASAAAPESTGRNNQGKGVVRESASSSATAAEPTTTPRDNRGKGIVRESSGASTSAEAPQATAPPKTDCKARRAIEFEA